MVVDPVARALTHLVVHPKNWGGLDRLVPLDLVDAAPGEVRLRCTSAEFDKLDAAEETRFLPGGSSYAGYDEGQALSWPYYGMGMGGMSMGGMGLGMMETVPQTVTTDTVPLGEVDVRRGDQVHAAGSYAPGSPRSATPYQSTPHYAATSTDSNRRSPTSSKKSTWPPKT